MSQMSESEIRSTVERLAPFFHNIQLPFGLQTYLSEQGRRPEEVNRVETLVPFVWPSIIEHFGSFSGLRVLDACCNAGGFSFLAARSGAVEVVGVDIVDHYLEQANFVKRALDLDNVQFHKCRVEQLHPSQFGAFDLTFLFDVLYHFENPVAAMKAIASVTTGMIVIDTITLEPDIDAPAWVMNVLPPSVEEAEDRSTSQWRTGHMCQFTPTKRAVMELLDFLGFDAVHVPVTKAYKNSRIEGSVDVFIGVRR